MKKVFVLCLFFLTTSAFAQISLESISMINAANNELFALNSFSENKGLVIVFIGNKCSYTNYYKERLKRLSSFVSNHSFGFLVVNAFDGEANLAESLAAMRDLYSENEFNFPYVKDEEGVLKNMLAAKRAPEAFLLKNNGGSNWGIKYVGAIDDNAQVEGQVKNEYIKKAIADLAADKVVAKSSTRTVGCLIK